MFFGPLPSRNTRTIIGLRMSDWYIGFDSILCPGPLALSSSVVFQYHLVLVLGSRLVGLVGSVESVSIRAQMGFSWASSNNASFACRRMSRS